jgi:hypothetical protein
MELLQYEKIESDNMVKRRNLFDLNTIGLERQAIYPTHCWSAARHIHTNQWKHPCARCELLHRGMDHYSTTGDRCVDWQEYYAPMNCGEPLALAIAIKLDKDGSRYE